MSRPDQLSRASAVILAALLSAAFVAILALPAAAGAEDKKVTIKALYKVPNRGPDCPPGDKMLPLPGAELAVQLGGRKVNTRLDKKGTAELKLKGSGKEMKAKVTLDGKLLSVKPYGEKSAHSYSDTLKLGDKKTYPIKITRLGKNGAASAWAILSKGVDLAGRSMPAGLTLPPVTARYDRGRGPTGGLPDLPGTQTAYDSDTEEILIDTKTRADEFESWPLLHEYGHHVLETVASPGKDAYGGHDLEHSYPAQPDLAWSEGFAHAFAALAQKNPVLGTLCRTGVNLATEPATPQSVDGSGLNQYHEISIGGVVWALATRLGGGDGQAGLKQLLSAFNTFHALNGSGPESLREARDALIEAGMEASADEHQDLTELFARQQIGWAFHLDVAPGRVNPRVHAGGGDGYRLRIEGPSPYERCEGVGSDPGEAPDDWLRENHYYYGTYFGGTRGASGALDYAWQDDCYTRTMVYPNWGTGYLDVPYPAPDDRGDPGAPFTVSVKWICESGDEDPCSSSSENLIGVTRGAWVRNSNQRPPGSSSQWWLERYGPPFRRYVNLPLDVWTPVVEFDALGHCTSLLDGGDCGV